MVRRFVRHSKIHPLMSALGHKRTFGIVQSMSALPPKADITERTGGVRFCQKRTYDRCLPLPANKSSAA